MNTDYEGIDDLGTNYRLKACFLFLIGGGLSVSGMAFLLSVCLGIVGCGWLCLFSISIYR